VSLRLPLFLVNRCAEVAACPLLALYPNQAITRFYGWRMRIWPSCAANLSCSRSLQRTCLPNRQRS